MCNCCKLFVAKPRLNSVLRSLFLGCLLTTAAVSSSAGEPLHPRGVAIFTAAVAPGEHGKVNNLLPVSQSKARECPGLVPYVGSEADGALAFNFGVVCRPQ